MARYVIMMNTFMMTINHFYFDYFDYDVPGDFDSYPSVYGLLGRIIMSCYEYYDLYGPHDCEVYSVSQGGVSVVPYWSGDDEWDVYESDVALPQTGSDEPFDGSGYSVINTSGPGGPGDPCDEKGDVSEDNVAMHWTGSDEIAFSVVRTSGPGGPGGPCDEKGDVSEDNVARHRTGSDETVVSVVNIISPGGPDRETGSVADAPGDAMVMLSECRDGDRGTLDNLRMWRDNPRPKSTVCCEPPSGVIFDEGVLVCDVCPAGKMCKLDCPWVSPY